MNRRSLAVALAVGFVTAGPAAAEHRGPEGLFPGQTAEQVGLKIAELCAARGFGVQTVDGAADVTCQGGELPRSEVVFRPTKPPDDPYSSPQLYHRFVVTDGADGAHVAEHTQMRWLLGGRLRTVEPTLIFAKIVNARVREFYAALAAAAAEDHDAASASSGSAAKNM